MADYVYFLQACGWLAIGGGVRSCRVFGARVQGGFLMERLRGHYSPLATYFVSTRKRQLVKAINGQ